MFSPERHIKRCDGGFSRYYLSCDYGTVNPFSLGLWGECDGKWYRLDEYYYSGRDNGIQLTDEEYYRELERLANGKDITALIIDPSAASFIQTVLRHKNFVLSKRIMMFYRVLTECARHSRMGRYLYIPAVPTQ